MVYSITNKEIRRRDYNAWLLFLLSLSFLASSVILSSVLVIYIQEIELFLYFLPVFSIGLVLFLLFLRRMKIIKNCLNDGIEAEAVIEKTNNRNSIAGVEAGLKIKYSCEIDGKKYFYNISIVKNYSVISNYDDYKNIGSKILILVNRLNYKKSIIKNIFIV